MYQKTKERAPMIGEVYMIKFEGSGSEQSGYRPGLILQNNTGNLYSPNVIALPLTSSLKKSNQPTHVIIRSEDSGLVKDSMVLAENPERISKDRLGKYITTLNDDYMSQVARAYLLATSVISFVNPDFLSEIWNNAVRLNAVA